MISLKNGKYGTEMTHNSDLLKVYCMPIANLAILCAHFSLFTFDYTRKTKKELQP